MAQRPEPAKCRSCSAEIYWVKTPDGKNMPIDAAPRADGGFVVGQSRSDGSLHASAYAVEMGNRSKYVSHFATCPDAAKHRKAK